MFTKDSRTETFLTQMGVEFKYSNNIRFGDLVRGWSERNLARPVPVREEAVLEYSALMEAGSPAPATILCLTEKGLDVLDGVQRLSAEEMIGSTHFSAYVVTSDSEDMLASIRVLANARLQGRPEPPEWTKRRAVELLVNNRGLSVEEVARMGGWRPADIRKIANAMDWGHKIRCIGGPNLTDAMIEVVAKHTTQDALPRAAKPIAEFLSAINTAKLSSTDAEPFVRDFFDGEDSHAAYTERLNEFTEDPEIQVRIHGRRGPELTRDVTLRRTLKSAVTILDEIAREGDEVLYVDEFFRLTKTIDAKLRKIARNHQAPVATRVPADMWK